MDEQAWASRGYYTQNGRCRARPFVWTSRVFYVQTKAHPVINQNLALPNGGPVPDINRRGPYHHAKQSLSGYFPDCQVSSITLFCTGGRSDLMKTLRGITVWIGFVGLAAAQAPTVGNCPVFPADNIWNTRVDQLPVHPSSSTWVATIGASSPVHADFGSGTRWRAHRNSVRNGASNATQVSRYVHVSERKRSRALCSTVERAHRRRQRQHR